MSYGPALHITVDGSHNIGFGRVFFNTTLCQCVPKYSLILDSVLNVLRSPFCTLTLGETGSMRMIDKDEVGSKEKP